LATISAENKLPTVILIFQVDPKMQKTLIDTAKENSQKVMEKKSGFISTNLHKSFDGTSVVNYSQWKFRKSYEDAINFLNPVSISTTPLRSSNNSISFFWFSGCTENLLIMVTKFASWEIVVGPLPAEKTRS